MNECTVDFCDREARTIKHGLCAAHEWQMLNGKPFTPIKAKKKSDIGVEGYRRCNNCDEIKKVSEFYKRHSQYGYYSRCKVCHNITQEATNAH